MVEEFLSMFTVLSKFTMPSMFTVTGHRNDFENGRARTVTSRFGILDGVAIVAALIPYKIQPRSFERSSGGVCCNPKICERSRD
ncbi:hypothetical protein KOR42_30610 [Thalassoglobus neptunius]|uniref:Uncharacterized protein n=1 Tax=Thalassoglobus neptunius TaxID=1938619 RepID=A0A5C5WQ80_9PLAN|nr:hypothetical protein KOR42_30610 [Thalassoglobus neptunius]